MTTRSPAIGLLFALALGACGSSKSYVRGTKIPDSEDNRAIVDLMERYRIAIERRDAPALMAMVSPRYWEDGGTTKADDDYGYDGLRRVVTTNLQRAEDIRFSIRYVRIQHRGEIAFVYYFIDGSFTLKSRRGESRPSQRDPAQMVLERQEGKWMILAGL
jgi:ketosteroid isomerase-like protein